MPVQSAPEARLEAFDAPAHVAQVTLIVRNAARVAGFYRDALGLLLGAEGPETTLAASDGTVLMRLIERPDARPAAPGEPGLFHTAFLLPTRGDLADWARHAEAIGLGLEGASDHLVSEAIYLSDPESNGIEIYVDRPRASWPMDGDMVKMATLRLDGASLMAEAGPASAPFRFPAGGRIGHVHLKVNDLAAAEAFWRDQAGLQVMARYPGAAFLGWGGYHHHIAVNVWSSKGAAARAAGAAGLAGISIAMAEAARGLPEPGVSLADPAGNVVRFAAA